MSLMRLNLKSLAFKAFLNSTTTFNFSVNNLKPLLSLYSPRIDIAFGKKTIAEELGIPEPPKRPITPFVQYFVDEQKKFSHLKVTERLKAISQNWKFLDESVKSQYQESYKIGVENFEKKLKEYNKSLTPEQVNDIEILKTKRKVQKEASLNKRKLRKDSEEFGKPKHPGNPMTLFMEDIKYEQHPPKEFLKHAQERWHNLPEPKKEIYRQKAKELMEKYRIDLYAWEIKMLEIGRKDMVRVSTIFSKNSSKKSQQKLGQGASGKK